MLFSICLAIFSELENTFLKCENIQEICEVLDRVQKKFSDPVKLLEVAN
jgi:hypothetical protein